MKFLCHNVLNPEPKIVGDMIVGWNLGFRAVLGSPERYPYVPTLKDGQLFYDAVFDFRSRARPVLPNTGGLNDEWRITPDGGDSYEMLLPPGETIIVGLGIVLDYGSFNWVHGSVSLRKRWMYNGLQLVNTNTPLHGGHRNEIFVLLRNNGPQSRVINARERPVQIHFFQGLLSPTIEIRDVSDGQYMI